MYRRVVLLLICFDFPREAQMLDIPVPFVCALEKKKKPYKARKGLSNRGCASLAKKKINVKNQNFCTSGGKKVLLAQRGSLQEA